MSRWNTESGSIGLKEVPMYSILYIIGAIVVIVFVLKVLGLF